MKAMKKYLRELGAEIEEAIESGGMSESDIASNCENWLTIHKFCECYGKWTETGNGIYKTFAQDELRHGETLIALAKQNPIAAADTDLLHGFEALRMELSGKLL